MNKEKKKYKGFFQGIEKHLSPDQIKRAKAKAKAEIFSIRLSELRKKQGIPQIRVKGFTQSGISKLESRSDMKLSTLLEYMDSIGMKLEIIVHSKSGRHKAVPLLKG